MAIDSVPGGLSTTQSLGISGSVSGTIDAVDVYTGGADEDWYQVSLTAGSAYRFDMASATLDGVLRVYDSTGYQWAYADNGFTGDPESLNFSPVSGGSYYVSVSGWGGYTTGDFSLSGAVTAATTSIDTVGDWYTDPNVGALPAAGSVNGSIDSSYDSDWYAVQLTAGQNYLFGLSSATPLDTSLTLYDANGSWLDSSWIYLGDESIFFSAASTGTYYLAVYGDYTNTGSFTLSSSAPATGGTGTDTIPAGVTTSATLAVGGSVNGTINSSTDYGDWYSVSLSGNTTYRFNLSAALLDGQLGLYDANGMSLSWADSGWTGEAESLVYTTTQAGTYYVGVSSYGGLAGDFQLDLSQLSAGGSTVDNVGGSSGAASLINIPGQVSGTIDNGTDADWYAVNLSANTLYQFDLSSFFIDGILAIYDANSVEQAYADNGLHTGDPESLHYTPTAAGTYYVAVSGYGGTTGSFQLDAIGYATQSGDFVADNASTTAAVSMPGTVWGAIDSTDSAGGDDADWYSVRLNAGTTYRVDLSGGSDLDGILALYGTNGTSWLAGADAGYQGGSEYFYYSPTVTGDYYVAVDGWSNTTGDFSLSVAQTSGESATTDTVGQTVGTSGSVAVSSTAPGHVDGAIDSSADADWYAVTLAANTQYEFNLGSSSLDGILQLYDSSGYELSYADNGWSAGDPENLVYTTPATGGTHYIGVSGYGSSTGDFLLDIYSSGTVSNVDAVGDTYQTAASGLLNVGGSAVRGQVDSGVDEDVYSVAFTANTSYLFDLSSTSLDGTLTLYGSAGEWLDSADYGGTGGSESLYFTPLTSGNYYISAGGWSSSTGSYDLNASALTVTGGEVPGDITSTQNLSVPGFVDNQIGVAADKDWFSIRMNQGSEYSFNLYSNDGALDGQLQVFGANGNPVYDQFGNGYVDNGWYAGDAENLYFTAPTTGDYFIQVSGYGGTTGSYSLHAAQSSDNYLSVTSYDDIKWDVIDWWSWDSATWATYSDPISWSAVGWNEIVDYSALDWSYVDWTEFNSTVYSDLNYEQIDWNELLLTDWNAIDWNYIYADSLNWNQLQYESTYDPNSNYDLLTGWNIDLTAAASAGNSNVLGGAANDTALLGIGLDYFSGGLGNDYADGGVGADNLVGGDGNDILNGGTGNDVMDGGAGNDTYYVDSSSDSVVETGNVSGSTTLGFRLALDLSGSIDKVIASISYTLGNYLENLDLATGTGNLAGTGNALDNVLTGNEGNNTLTGGAGNDSLDGSTGIDSASYTGTRASFTLAQSGAAFIVTDSTGAEGADTVTNIERLVFSNSRIALDITDGNAGTAAKILGAVFGAASVSNRAYVGVGLNYLDGGTSYSDLMALALNVAGATSSNAVVNLLWTNLFGAAPTAAEAASFIAMLDNGTYSTGALGVLAADTSLNTTNINLVGLAQTGIEYI